MRRPPVPRSTPLPYTTLFRSQIERAPVHRPGPARGDRDGPGVGEAGKPARLIERPVPPADAVGGAVAVERAAPPYRQRLADGDLPLVVVLGIQGPRALGPGQR